MASKAAQAQEQAHEPTTNAHIERIKATIVTLFGVDTKREFFKLLDENEPLLRNVVSRVLGEKYKETTSQQDARAIMDSYCGVAEAAMYFNYSPSETELPLFAELSLSKEELEAFRHTHFLFAYLPRSIREIQAVHNQTVLNWEYYGNEEFIDAKSPPGWYLLRKTVIQESLDRPFADQTSLLPPNEELPAPDVLVYAVLLHLAHVKNEEQLFCGMKLRCTPRLDGNSTRPNEKGSGVILGSHDSTAPHCLHLAHLPVDQPVAHLGVTGVRRLRSSV